MNSRKPKKRRHGEIAAAFAAVKDAGDAKKSRMKVERLLQKGASLADAGDFSGALREFEIVIAQGHRSAKLLEMRAQVLMQLNRDFEAIRSAEACIVVRPEWDAAWHTLGRAQLNFGEVKLALDSFRKAETLNRRDPSIREDVAHAEILLRRMEEKTGGIATRARVGTGVVSTQSDASNTQLDLSER